MRGLQLYPPPTEKLPIELAQETPAPSPDSLIVHVLFIDLVGYSKLTMEEQKRSSRELAESVMETAGFRIGIETGVLTCLDTGDGMALVFEGDPTAPALTSLEVAACRGCSPKRPIRMGIHSGPAMRVLDINGKVNFKGVGVNVTQRVMDCAIPGQITMTEHYASILRSYEGWNERILSRGPYTVKHGLRIRVCELLYPFSPKMPLSYHLHKELPAVPYGARWLGICLLLVFIFLVLLHEATGVSRGINNPYNWQGGDEIHRDE